MATNRLTRNPQRAILGGVCAGIADRLDADLNLVRLLAILLAVVTAGFAVLVYVALWLIMPLPDAPPGLPSRDAISEELRGAGERAREAADIISRAARQAASELSEASAKRTGAAGAATEAVAEAAQDVRSEVTESGPVPPANPQPYAPEDVQRQQEQQQQQ